MLPINIKTRVLTLPIAILSLRHAIPAKVAQELGINLFVMDIETAGGNYMCNGMGIASSSDLIWLENNGYSHAEIDQIFEEYLGIEEYHVLPDPNNTYIDHIDCWGKFLDVDKVMIRSVPVSHPQYDEIEATAAYYAAQMSSYGTPFEVYRVYTPNNQPYTNSLILNKKVIVPIMNSQWDDGAIASYEEAMPGYEVLGFTGGWQSTDALHCRTKGLADIGMLHINHVALMGEQPVQAEYNVEATIIALSGQPVYSDSAIIYYRVNGAEWELVNMENTSGQSWSGAISGASQGSEIEYYLYVADGSGRRETHPFIGKPDPHTFFVGEQAFAQININPTSIYATATVGQTTETSFTITNTGLIDLNFTIATNITVLEELNYDVENSPSASTYNYNTHTELGWTDLEVEDPGDVAAFEISYTWATDNYPEEGSLHVECPSGTETIIASGAPSGTYTVDATAFNGAEMNGTWKTWIEDTYGDGGCQATNITVNISRVKSEIGWLGPISPTTGTIEPGGSIECMVSCNAEELEAGTFEGTITVNSNDPGYPVVEIPASFEVTAPTSLKIDITAFLEGPYNGANMNTDINSVLPTSQPFSGNPWNYSGTESVGPIHGTDIVDWVLIDIRDTASADVATPATSIGMQAALLRNDGRVVDTAGNPVLTFANTSVINNLFVVVFPRNHIPVISANAVTQTGGVYSHNFSSGESQALGGTNGHTNLGQDVWGMFSGNSNGDFIVNGSDKDVNWITESGLSGYLSSDVNLDKQSDNQDKNEFWVPNNGNESSVPH
ncbi:MAG: hypothetical protein B6D64_03415 [Bacteroidetes bacterium 4484_276]|nr:MAG: hypothetical protein B6D64_03415 [Bacteroidetes bacterium 4484_276]